MLFALSHKKGLKSFVLPIGNTTLSNMAKRWRTALGERRLDRLQSAMNAERREARSLYQCLLAPLERAGWLHPGHYARLVIVPDGPLNDLPFAALMDSTGKRLVERYALSSAVSLGSLTWPVNHIKPSGTLLCAVAPTGIGVFSSSHSFRDRPGSLPSARKEGKEVVDLFPGALWLTGPKVRKAEIKRHMGRYAILHFAVHGVLDARNGLRSGLVLAPEPAGSTEDNFLEAREIIGMRLAARLAVLSACRTAEGQQSGGDGLLGLAWAFQAAGCPSIVASQWSIDDAATERLMAAFYKGLKAHKPKDEALRQAMLVVKREKRYAPPFYWAAFEAIGDTAPL